MEPRAELIDLCVRHGSKMVLGALRALKTAYLDEPEVLEAATLVGATREAIDLDQLSDRAVLHALRHCRAAAEREFRPI